MVISNLMLAVWRSRPKEEQRWFMERYLDSYEMGDGPESVRHGPDERWRPLLPNQALHRQLQTTSLKWATFKTRPLVRDLGWPSTGASLTTTRPLPCNPRLLDDGEPASTRWIPRSAELGLSDLQLKLSWRAPRLCLGFSRSLRWLKEPLIGNVWENPLHSEGLWPTEARPPGNLIQRYRERTKVRHYARDCEDL